jgi:hypothetical protein
MDLDESNNKVDDESGKGPGSDSEDSMMVS